jgi:hypothetical protein
VIIRHTLGADTSDSREHFLLTMHIDWLNFVLIRCCELDEIHFQTGGFMVCVLLRCIQGQCEAFSCMVTSVCVIVLMLLRWFDVWEGFYWTIHVEFGRGVALRCHFIGHFFHFALTQ